MENLKSCSRCCPHTEEIFCVEKEGVRRRYFLDNDSKPVVMDTPIDDCPELAIIDLMERPHGKRSKNL